MRPWTLRHDAELTPRLEADTAVLDARTRCPVRIHSGRGMSLLGSGRMMVLGSGSGVKGRVALNGSSGGIGRRGSLTPAVPPLSGPSRPPGFPAGTFLPISLRIARISFCFIPPVCSRNTAGPRVFAGSEAASSHCDLWGNDGDGPGGAGRVIAGDRFDVASPRVRGISRPDFGTAESASRVFRPAPRRFRG